MKPYIAKLTKKSDFGDYRSKCLLAFEYWSGNKIKQDYKKAFKLWMELAKINGPCGLFNIATMYREGYGIKVNIKLAKKFYLLCTKVKSNKNLPKNIKDSNEWFIRQSYYSLGESLYLKGKYKFDNKLAIKYMSKAADIGHFHAAYQLGHFHDPNVDMMHGIKKNVKTAIRYYELSCNHNYLPALTSLRDIYLTGVKIKKDFFLAKIYQKKAMQVKISKKKIEQLNLENLPLQLDLLHKLSKSVKENNKYFKKI